MQSNIKNKRKNSFIGTKIIIGLVSLAGTFGLWNLFTAKPVETAKPTPENGKTNPQDASSQLLELPPLPTLVPIVDPAAGQSQTQNAGNTPVSGLRQVTQPTPVPPVNNKPVFNRITINRPGNSGSTSSGSSR